MDYFRALATSQHFAQEFRWIKEGPTAVAAAVTAQELGGDATAAGDTHDSPTAGDSLTGLPGSFEAREGDAATPWTTIHGGTGDEDHYLAVATSPPTGIRIQPGEAGYFGVGWHTESHHDAGMTAVDECRRQGGGSACSFNASGTSLRGGCVGLAMVKWRDRREGPGRAYVVTSSSFPSVITRDLRSGCESTAFSGKYADTVVEHVCEIVRIMCAGDIVPATMTPAQ